MHYVDFGSGFICQAISIQNTAAVVCVHIRLHHAPLALPRVDKTTLGTTYVGEKAFPTIAQKQF